jgi:hypothetical protein
VRRGSGHRADGIDRFESGHPEFVELVAEDPLLFLEREQRLFAEGDVPTCRRRTGFHLNEPN